MLLTIIVPTLNSAGTLGRCLKSLTVQSLKSFEVIIVDSNSSDETLNIATAFKKTLNLRIVSDERNGIASAWNLGLSCAVGDWCYFLGSDDELYDGFVIEKFARAVRDLGETTVPLLYGQVSNVDCSGKEWMRSGIDWQCFRHRFFFAGSNLPHQGIFYPMRIFKQYGFFDSRFSYAADYDFNLRILRKMTPTFLPNFLVCKMYYGGITSNYGYLDLVREFRLVRIKNAQSETLGTIFLSFRAYIRFFLRKLIGQCKAKFCENRIRRLLGRPVIPLK